MKPLSSHWADASAAKLVAQKPNQDTFVVASGITPSGVVHIGNFREVITVDLVARALRDLGKTVRFIYSWDDFDTFRKIPPNFPNQEMLKTHLRKSIVRVPDPYGKEESYARHNEVTFEKDVGRVGINPEFIYQSREYSSGRYAKEIRHALEHIEDIRKILDAHRTEPLAQDWLPTMIFCEQCERDEMEYERYAGEWNYQYKCRHCQVEKTTDIRTTKNLKLAWRIDWPMRWNVEKVDFEPGGKDHSNQGGSFDTAKEIVRKLWHREPPVYLQYDFVTIKGLGGKMSSSKGNVISLADALDVYTPQMLRWIFANQRSNHDFAIAFDEDVIKTYDEFDRAEAHAYQATGYSDPKIGITRRIYDLSLVDPSKKWDQTPFRASFRTLCNRLQICDGEAERTMSKFYARDIKTPVDRELFLERCQLAWNWLNQHAADEFRYKINNEKVEVTAGPSEEQALINLRQLIDAVDLEAIDAKDLNQKIYDDVLRASQCDSKEFFRTVYQKLISRDQGPRLPSFLKEIGKERLLKLL